MSNEKPSVDIKVKDYHFRKEDLVCISPDEFISGSTMPADVFLKLNEEKFVMIAREGGKSGFNEMRFSESISVEHMYVRRTDYFKCVKQNLTVAGIVVKSSEISDEKKSNFLAKTTETVFKEIEHLGFNNESLSHAKSVTAAINILVESKDNLSALVRSLHSINAEVIRHSMAVCAISLMIGKNMGWVITAVMEKMALGALLHDIGLKEIPKELIDKPRFEMSPEERLQYENHAFRGVEILRTVPNMSEDIFAIVFEHHENAIAQGYPRKLKDQKMNPLSKVVAAADFFSELTLKSISNPDPMTPEAAINYIRSTLGQPFNKKVFEALQLSLTKVNKVGSVKLVY